MTIVLPMHPLTMHEVVTLTTPLTQRQITRAEGDIDYARIMREPSLRTCARVFSNCVGSLVALGYGYPWLAKILDVPVEDLFPPQDSPVSTDLMRDALTVAIHIGNRWATPEATGQTEEEIEHAKHRARAEHRQTPAAYDPIYNYVARSAPVDDYITRRSADVRDALKIRAMALVVERGGSAASIGQRVGGISGRTVDRARDMIGLEVDHVANDEVTVAPGQAKLVRAVLRAHVELGMGVKHPTLIWTNLVTEAADIHAAAVANPHALAA